MSGLLWSWRLAHLDARIEKHEAALRRLRKRRARLIVPHPTETTQEAHRG